MLEQLIKHIRHEEVSIFIGSGFSKEALAPTVDDLKKLILEDIDNKDIKEKHQNDGLDVLSEFYVNQICGDSRNELINLLQKAFVFTPKCMDDHKMLAKIPHFRNIFTTNYDTLLEDSYPKGEMRVVRNDKGIAYADKFFTIYKIHGDFTDPDSVIITTSDYEALLNSERNTIVWDKVTTEFANKHMLFLGYSMKDENVLKIIHHVSNCLGKNLKKMYVVAPYWKEEEQRALESINAAYINLTAKDFLITLTKELKENVADDFNAGFISSEVHTKFWSHYDAVPTITQKVDGKNIINEINPLPGKTIEHKIQLSVNKDGRDLLENMDFEKNGEYSANGIYKDVPFMRLSGDKLLECTYFVNTVTLNKNIKEVIISPEKRDLELTIRIPSRDFFDSVSAKGFRLNKLKSRILVDCHIYNMTIDISFAEDLHTTSLSFSFEFNNTYNNNNEAIKWIDVISAFFSKEDIIIQELSNIPLNLSKTGKDIPHPFEQFKQYYKDIKQIELRTGKKFKVYKECTEQTCRYARFVAAYLAHEYVSVYNEHVTCFDFSTNYIEAGDFVEKNIVHETVSIVSTEDKVKIYSLNNKSFTIPYAHYVYNACEIKNIDKRDDGMIRVDFHYPSHKYAVLFSSKPASEEFPEMKPLGRLLDS